MKGSFLFAACICIFVSISSAVDSRIRLAMNRDKANEFFDEFLHQYHFFFIREYRRKLVELCIFGIITKMGFNLLFIPFFFLEIVWKNDQKFV